MLIVLIRVTNYRNLGCRECQNNTLMCRVWADCYLPTNFMTQKWDHHAMGLLSLTFMELAPISDNLLKNFISNEKEVLWESIQSKGLVFIETLGSVSGRKWHLSKFWKASRILTGYLERRHYGLGVTIWLEGRRRVLGGTRNWLDCGRWTWREGQEKVSPGRVVTGTAWRVLNASLRHCAFCSESWPVFGKT